jgi:acyl-CoA thioesterase FadM
VKIDDLGSYPFSTELEVRVSDLNYGAHLGHDAIVAMAHEARVRFFRNLGVSELDLGDGKTGVIAVDLAVSYKGEAFLNDILEFGIKPVEVGRGSFRLAYRARTTDGRIVALLEIGLAAFDYKASKPGALPGAFRDTLLATTT